MEVAANAKSPAVFAATPCVFGQGQHLASSPGSTDQVTDGPAESSSLAEQFWHVSHKTLNDLSSFASFGRPAAAAVFLPQHKS